MLQMEDSSFMPQASLSVPGLLVLGGESLVHDSVHKDMMYGSSAGFPAMYSSPSGSGDAYYPSAFLPTGAAAAALRSRPYVTGRPGSILNSSSNSAFTPLLPQQQQLGGELRFVSVSPSAFAPLPPRLLSSQTVDLGGSGASGFKVETSPDCGLAAQQLNENSIGDLASTDAGGGCDDSRSLRQKRKKNSLIDGQVACPICGVTLRANEIGAHFSVELDRLDKLYKHSGKKSLSSNFTTSLRQSSTASPPDIDNQAAALKESFQQVKHNRQARLASGKGKTKRKKNEPVCPVCGEKLPGGTTAEELSEHVERCLKKASDDDEGDDEFEEYEWAGQTRVRATTMLPGGSLAASGFQVSSQAGSGSCEDDVDLNVDADDIVEQFGTTQYGEADIIPCASDQPEEDLEREALRGALLSGSDAVVRPTVGSCSRGNASKWSPGDEPASVSSNGGTTDVGNAALTSNDSFKCLICMDRYTKPLVSVQCWHVHCEECWLRTLGAKKLCPQCNAITSPSILRLIYL